MDIRRLLREIGGNLSAARSGQRPPMSQFDLAAAAGSRPSSVSRIERGNSDFRVSNLLRYAAALGLAPADLLPEGPPGVERE